MEDGPSGLDRDRLLARCRTLVEQMVTLTEDLRALGVARQPHREPLRLAAFLDDVCRPLEFPRNFHLTLPALPAEEQVFCANQYLLVYAIRNQLRNAVDGGSVGLGL